QGLVRRSAFTRRRCLHDRRADQRVAKRQVALACIRANEVGPLREGKIIDVRVALRSCSDRGQTRIGLQRGQQQQLSGGCGQGVHPGGEGGLQPPVQGQEFGQRVLAGALPVGQRRGQFPQRERVAGGLIEQPLSYRGCQVWVPGVQQGGR